MHPLVRYFDERLKQFLKYTIHFLVSKRYALTAAHCLSGRSTSTTGLLVGDHNIKTGTETTFSALYTIRSFIMHSSYNSNTGANDIGLVLTNVVITFNRGVGPVCLPFRFSNQAFGSIVTALG